MDAGVLVTKSFLYKINKTDSDRCSICDQDSETISHLFYHCDKAKKFWSALKSWLRVNGNINLALTIKTVLFFINKENKLLYHLLILARYFIYKTKFISNYITLETFLSYLRRKYQTEKYIEDFIISMKTFNASGQN